MRRDDGLDVLRQQSGFARAGTQGRMINNYYILQALIREWTAYLPGGVIEEVYTQERGTLAMALILPDGPSTVHIMTRPPLVGIFRTPSHSKARRNVASVFHAARGRRIVSVQLADRDRLLRLVLGGGMDIRAILYGSRANVFLIGSDGSVQEAFRSGAEWAGEAPPEARPAPQVDTLDTFLERWQPAGKTTAQAVGRAFPLFDRNLGEEVACRADLALRPASSLKDADRRLLFAMAMDLKDELATPAPHIYGDHAHLSIIPLHHRAAERTEAMDTVDHAVLVFSKRVLGAVRLKEQRDPMIKSLTRALASMQQRAERMRRELDAACRADRYERWGHLLMAVSITPPPGAESITLPDAFEDHAPVRIPLDPARSRIANAERYYRKARKARQSREHLHDRLVHTESQIGDLATLLSAAGAANTPSSFKAFLKLEKTRLARILPGPSAGAQLPFRRYAIREGYEVWVGRNARESDVLTLRHARPFDYWLHARGVPGSHAVLRLPRRNDTPPKAVLEAAARIAAYFSKARSSNLAPVIVTPRKYVRKSKGAAPGLVMVEREEVLIVKPELPT